MEWWSGRDYLPGHQEELPAGTRQYHDCINNNKRHATPHIGSDKHIMPLAAQGCVLKTHVVRYACRFFGIILREISQNLM